MDKILNMLGLMRRANAIQIGETNTGSAVRAGKAKLLLLASDASDNAKEPGGRLRPGQECDHRIPALCQGGDIRRRRRERLFHGGRDGPGLCKRNYEEPSELRPETFSEAAGEVEERFQRRSGEKRRPLPTRETRD